MKKRPIRIGDLLLELGRVTPEQIERALAHQRDHGGYLGEALVRLGVITREELRWCLADQHDLPFVNLRPENIDRALAAQVPAEWAREHMALPVLRNGDTVTAVLEDLAGLEMLEDVRRFTGAMEVEPALSSPENIRELLDAVFGAGSGPPISIVRLIEEALEQGASTIGVSVRPGRALGWYRTEEMVSRALRSEWAAELQELVSPPAPLTGSPAHGPQRWPAFLSIGDRTWKAECSAIRGGDALEWVVRIDRPLQMDPGTVRVDPAVAVAARLALAGGGLLVRVHGEGALQESVHVDVLESALPALPSLLCGEQLRSLHLSDRPIASPNSVLHLQLGQPIEDVLPELAPFALDALTLSIERINAAELDSVRGAAPLAVFAIRAESGSTLPADMDLRLLADGEGLLWTRIEDENGTD